MPPMPKTTQAERKPPPNKEVTRERVLQVAQAIKEGRIQPPALKSNQRLFLGDSGAAPNVANHKRHFPGADLGRSAAQNQGKAVITADGSVTVTTINTHAKNSVFPNADVGMPIVSMPTSC